MIHTLLALLRSHQRLALVVLEFQQLMVDLSVLHLLVLVVNHLLEVSLTQLKV